MSFSCDDTNCQNENLNGQKYDDIIKMNDWAKVAHDPVARCYGH